LTDAQLIERAKDRAAKAEFRNERRISKLSNTEAQCPFCGRYWRVYNRHGSGQLGFILSVGENHAITCEHATPEERRAMARHDEKRWAKNPPANTIRNNSDHAGYGGINFRAQ
jgi:hypothetical protein